MDRRKFRVSVERNVLSFIWTLLFIGIWALVPYAAMADPAGPNTITIAGSGRHTNETSPVPVQANAGNVTGLVINMTKVTQAWQGYYGNITGTIALDDGGNFTMYDWSLPNPSGEVYASNFSTVTWGNIYCMNVSSLRNASGSISNGNDAYYRINGSQIELNFGINSTDGDGLNETFNDTYTSASGFKVGSITIDSTDGCSAAHPFTSELYNTGWEELLLSDNNSLVFTSILRDGADGFQPGTSDNYDFQTLVLENGHSGWDTQLTNYYFFVELN